MDLPFVVLATLSPVPDIGLPRAGTPGDVPGAGRRGGGREALSEAPTSLIETKEAA
jgi:hypothetical protein